MYIKEILRKVNTKIPKDIINAMIIFTKVLSKRERNMGVENFSKLWIKIMLKQQRNEMLYFKMTKY
jgi:hypothetical protein